MSAKRYLAVWGAGYGHHVATYSGHGITTHFSEGNGYGAADIAAIEALEVGEAWRAPTPETHTVVRLPDGRAS